MPNIPITLHTIDEAYQKLVSNLSNHSLSKEELKQQFRECIDAEFSLSEARACSESSDLGELKFAPEQYLILAGLVYAQIENHPNIDRLIELLKVAFTLTRGKKTCVQSNLLAAIENIKTEVRSFSTNESYYYQLLALLNYWCAFYETNDNKKIVFLCEALDQLSRLTQETENGSNLAYKNLIRCYKTFTCCYDSIDEYKQCQLLTTLKKYHLHLQNVLESFKINPLDIDSNELKSFESFLITRDKYIRIYDIQLRRIVSQAQATINKVDKKTPYLSSEKNCDKKINAHGILMKCLPKADGYAHAEKILDVLEIVNLNNYKVKLNSTIHLVQECVKLITLDRSLTINEINLITQFICNSFKKVFPVFEIYFDPIEQIKLIEFSADILSTSLSNEDKDIVLNILSSHMKISIMIHFILEEYPNSNLDRWKEYYHKLELFLNAIAQRWSNDLGIISRVAAFNQVGSFFQGEQRTNESEKLLTNVDFILFSAEVKKELETQARKLLDREFAEIAKIKIKIYYEDHKQSKKEFLNATCGTEAKEEAYKDMKKLCDQGQNLYHKIPADYRSDDLFLYIAKIYYKMATCEESKSTGLKKALILYRDALHSLLSIDKKDSTVYHSLNMICYKLALILQGSPLSDFFHFATHIYYSTESEAPEVKANVLIAKSWRRFNMISNNLLKNLKLSDISLVEDVILLIESWLKEVTQPTFPRSYEASLEESDSSLLFRKELEVNLEYQEQIKEHIVELRNALKLYNQFHMDDHTPYALAVANRIVSLERENATLKEQLTELTGQITKLERDKMTSTETHSQEGPKRIRPEDFADEKSETKARRVHGLY